MLIREFEFDWNPSYTIFSSKAYLSAQSPFFGWIGGFEKDQLLFVLPFVVKKKLFLKYLSFQSETIFVLDDLAPEQEMEFLESTITYFKKKNIDFIIQPPTHVVFNRSPAKAINAPFGSYFLDLKLSEEDLWKNMNQKHRNVIRNAEKSGIRIEMGAKHTEAAFELIQETMTRSNMSFYSKEEFMSLAGKLEDKMATFVAFSGNEPQGCAIFPFSLQGAYYSFGGSIAKPELGSLNFLHWVAIKHFKSLGVAKYDFVGARIHPPEGSKLEGIQRFKSRFGATMKTGQLWKFALKKDRYYIYRLLQQLRAICKSGTINDVIDQERKRNRA